MRVSKGNVVAQSKRGDASEAKLHRQSLSARQIDCRIRGVASKGKRRSLGASRPIVKRKIGHRLQVCKNRPLTWSLKVQHLWKLSRWSPQWIAIRYPLSYRDAAAQSLAGYTGRLLSRCQWDLASLAFERPKEPNRGAIVNLPAKRSNRQSKSFRGRANWSAATNTVTQGDRRQSCGCVAQII